MDKKDMQYKTIEINEVKATKEEGKFYLEGYANNKNKVDSYGDRPTSFKGEPVYDLKRMKKNPVMLVDHNNSAAKVMGNFVKLKEDDKGLYFKALLRNPEGLSQPDLKDVINGYMNGFIRSLSIGGRWHFEDKDNPMHLTKAEIFEISGVAVGADGLALTTVSKPKKIGEKIEQPSKAETIRNLIKQYRESKDSKIINQIMEAKK
jgi:HK97 family phage prohead protease